MHIPIFLSLVCIAFLSGCSPNFKSAIDSVEVAVAFNQEKKITPEYLASIPYANSLVTINNDFQVLMVLAYIDKNPVSNATQLTWVTSARESIVTENGRIIHTTGFYNNNLEELGGERHHLPIPGSTTNWQAVYDWSPGYRYNFSASVNSKSLGMETLSTPLWTQPAEHIQEMVSFNSLDSEFINNFWIAQETSSTKAYIIKSIQYLGPKMDKVEMLMMKPFIEPIQNSSLSSNTKDSES